MTDDGATTQLLADAISQWFQYPALTQVLI